MGSTLFGADFNTGALIDTSGNSIAFTHGTASSITGGAYALNGKAATSGGNYLALERDASLFSQKQFSISMDFKAASANNGGVIFNMHTGLQIVVTDDGEVAFKLLENAAGQKGTVLSTGLNVANTAWHNLKLDYDAVAGKMTGWVDGKAVGSINVTAAMKPVEYWDPTIGGQWSDGFYGSVDNITMASGSTTTATPTPTYTPTPTSTTTVSGTIDQMFAQASKIFPKAILIDSSTELQTVLSKVTGGETLLLRPDVTYKVTVTSMPSHSAPVLVTSLDPNKMANITGLDLRNVNNVKFDNLHFESKAGAGVTDIKVTASSNVTFSDSIFKGSATGYVYAGGKVAQSAFSVQSTNGFTLENSEVSNFYHGVGFGKSSNVKLFDNDLHHIQGDGMRFSQMQGVTIENNWFHDFLGTDQSVNHSDYIQFWTAGTTTGSKDIVIRGNILAKGAYNSQSILMRDDVGDAGGTATRFKNVLIEENFINNNHHHGITLIRGDGVIIRDNTLPTMPGGTYGMVSSINVENSTGVQVYNNIVPKTTFLGTNQILRKDGNVVPTKVIANISSEYEGSNTFDFDARYTASTKGWVKATDAKFNWDFGDGTKASGINVTHKYAGAGDYNVLLTVLHNDGTTDTAQMKATHATTADQAQDANNSLGFLHHMDPWGL